jgi:two-component system phosphate regulon response regulator OmpR
MAERVLVVEDDPRLAEMLCEYLGQAGFRVTLAPAGGTALRQLADGGYDAVVLDLMLPDMDGLDVCRQLRARADTPVLMLTARGDAIDRIIGLELGADDYLPKPFEPRELLAVTSDPTPSDQRKSCRGAATSLREIGDRRRGARSAARWHPARAHQLSV